MATTAAAGTLVVLGIPTVLIPNGVFTREIEPTWWSYPVWILTAVLAGLLIATYAGPPSTQVCPTGADRKALAGGTLAWFAIACPVCNKLVLLAIGTSGALTWFAPFQPILAAAGLVLLALALRLRLRGMTPPRRNPDLTARARQGGFDGVSTATNVKGERQEAGRRWERRHPVASRWSWR